MAGSKKDGFETSILQHIFQNGNIANIGDTTGLRGSATSGSLYVSLFSVDPSDSTQGTEAVYTNYTRVAVIRNPTTWTVASSGCSNASAISFPTCGVTGETLTAFGVCTSSATGINDAIYWGELTSNLIVSNGITPEFAIGSLVINED